MRATIRAALARHDGNRTYAARDLGIGREYLLRLIKKFELNGKC